MPDDTDILGLPLILPSQAQKHVTHNEALAVLDVVVQLAVLARNQTVPPTLAAVGDRHIVPAGATVEWAGRDGQVAVMTETGWQFHAPNPGWVAQVLTEGQAAVFDGLAWSTPSEGAASFARLGVSATPDATNRLSVSSPATLLNHAGAGHQLKLNKAVPTDTASLLFQTGFSGRAEMGTAGSDGFSVKVSADGSAWSTALETDPASGEVTLPAPLHLGGQAGDPVSPANGTLWLNTTTGDVKCRTAGATVTLGAGGGGVSDGDKGDITVSGGGASWVVDAGAITLSKMADLANSRIIGRVTAGTGTPEALTAAQVRTLINVEDGANAYSHPNHTGDVISTGDGATAIANDAVTNTKLANMAANTIKVRAAATAGDPSDLALAASQLLGRGSTGDVAPINLGAGLTMSGTTLSASAGGVTDGDKGDIIVSGGGTTWTIDTGAVTSAKLNSDVWSTNQSILGNWNVGNGTGSPVWTINGAAGNSRVLEWDTAGVVRWRMIADNTAESGSNAGTRLQLNAFSDAGAFLGNVFLIERATQVVAFAQAPTIAGATLAETIDDRVNVLIVAGSGITKTYDDTANTLTIAATGGGGGGPVLGNWDFWEESWVGNTLTTAMDGFTGAAIGSGTANTAIPTAAMFGYNPHGVFLRSSTTANGGFRYNTSRVDSDYFGTISHKFRARFLRRTSFTDRTVRIGFLDTTSSADATDGAYFEVLGATCSAKTANNSTRATNATTATLLLDTAYTFEIDVNAAGTEARFRVFEGLNATPVLDVTNTTNIPTTSARTFGAGLIATEASTTASDIGILYSLGVGTVEGFQRATGRS